MKFGKHINIAAAVMAALGIAGFTANTAIAASDTGTANATIVSAISITAANTLEFGDILNGAANTVTVDTTGARSATDGTQLIGGTFQAASFGVSGDGNRAYTITLPADGVVTLTGPGPAMAVNGFTHDAGASPALTAGSDTFNVGASLSVANGQTAGSYTGSFTVTVNY